MRIVIAYDLHVAVVIRRSEQVPDNRLRKVVKIFYNLVALTLCDCATRMMQTCLARSWAKCDHLIWMILHTRFARLIEHIDERSEIDRLAQQVS